MMRYEQMFVPRPINRFQSRTIEYLMPKILNNIPPELRTLENANQLKKDLKVFYLSSQ